MCIFDDKKYLGQSCVLAGNAAIFINNELSRIFAYRTRTLIKTERLYQMEPILLHFSYSLQFFFSSFKVTNINFMFC